MPKALFPETFSCENSEQMNNVLKSKVIFDQSAITGVKTRGYAAHIVASGEDEDWNSH
jgi:hypothetical protein